MVPAGAMSIAEFITAGGWLVPCMQALGTTPQLCSLALHAISKGQVCADEQRGARRTPAHTLP